jgi:hypothetical protein
MKSLTISRLFSTNLMLLVCLRLASQTVMSVYSDIGKNNVSEGIFIKSATMGYYKSGKYSLEAGFQTELKNNNKKGFSGYTMNAARSFMIKEIPLELKGFYTRTFPTQLLEETNWGTILKISQKHFEMSIGTNFRSYNFRPRTADIYEINNKNNKVHEIYNIMYSFSYNLKPSDNNWNVGLSVSNIDHFIINQETNPVFNLNGSYKLNSRICLNIQAWYKYAGVTNLELDHFGYFFRTGIIWNIN